MKIQFKSFYTNLCPTKPLQFRNTNFGHYEDLFTRSQIKNPENNIDNANKTGVQMQDIIKKINIRQMGYPEVMISPMSLTLSYVKGIIDRNFYIEKYREESIPMYERIELGDNKEELERSYGVEIDMFRHISKICGQNELTDEDFRNNIISILTDYASADISRNEHMMH